MRPSLGTRRPSHSTRSTSRHTTTWALRSGHKGQWEEAIACYQKAIELDPKLAKAHYNLGLALADKGQLDEAIASYKKALAIDPKHAMAHYDLGIALVRTAQVDEAIVWYKKAIALDPKYAEAHCNLGQAFRTQGRFAEALAAVQRGHELGTKRPGWPYPSAEWVRQAENMAAMESKLPAFLRGEFQPKDATERLGLAGVCQAKKLHSAAMQLYAEAFAADATLADDLKAGHRYDAACFAARAAAGEVENPAKLDNKERTRLRQQALDWLRRPGPAPQATGDRQAHRPRRCAAGAASLADGHRSGRHP